MKNKHLKACGFWRETSRDDYCFLSFKRKFYIKIFLIVKKKPFVVWNACLTVILAFSLCLKSGVILLSNGFSIMRLFQIQLSPKSTREHLRGLIFISSYSLWSCFLTSLVHRMVRIPCKLRRHADSDSGFPVQSSNQPALIYECFYH